LDRRSLYGLALDLSTLAVLRLTERYLVSGEAVPMESPVDLVLKEVELLLEDRYRLEEVLDKRKVRKACFDIVHLSGVPVIVGKVCGEGGLETIGSVFTDRRASILFLVSYGLSEFDHVMERLGVETADVRAECRRLLVQDPDPTSGRVSEEVIESWVEAGFEVRVVREDVRKGFGVHTKAYYTDNIMTITSANLTVKGLERLRDCGEIVISMVSDLKAPVAILESDPLGLATVASANVHASVLYQFLTAPTEVYDERKDEHGFCEEYGGYLPGHDHEGIHRLYRDLKAGLRRYLREGAPSLLWWLEPEPSTTSP